MSHYSEDRKQPWGAVVVIIAMMIFGVIIWGAVTKPPFCPPFCPPPTPTPTGGATSTLQPTTSPGGAPPSPTPNPTQVEISFYSSNTKEDWINAVTEKFNAAGVKTSSGKPVFARVTHVTSGGSQKDILDGKIQPIVWSPGDQSWVDGLNQKLVDRNEQPLVTEACPPTIQAPVGFAMWRPMAEAMGWPDKPIGWDEMVALAADPQGWAHYGHPEWGQFKFGHTNPLYSNSGMLMLTALVYSTLNVTDGLTFQTVKSQAVVDAMRQLELHTYHYGEQSRALLELMARRGTSYLHASTSTEAETLKYNAEHGAALRYPFVFIFPAEGEYWTGQLYCILDAPWVSADQREAAQLYRDYLLAPEQQALANDYYLRPLDTSLPLDCPICLDSGTDPRANPQTVPDLGVPSTEASAAVKELFIETKKKATVVVVLDISGSMQGDKIKGATQATANFISRLYTDDYVMVIAFNNQMIELQPSGFKREVGDDLEGKVRNLPAEGGTALYDAVCQAVERVEALQAADEAAGDKRLYGIVVLSDGKDTASHKTENDMFNICLPSGEAVEGVKVFTIAYGEDAETDLLLRIANRTNGKSFAADPATIEKVYNSISAEQ